MVRLLDVQTHEAGPIKTLIEVLKDMLNEANIQFIRPNKKIKSKDEDKKKKKKDDEDNEDVEADDEEVEKKKKSKAKKSKAKKKKKKTDDSDTEIEEDSDAEVEEVEEDKDEEAVIKRDPGGVKITAVDNNKTVLISLKLDANKFRRFECSKKKITLGVNLNLLHKYTRTLDQKDDHITFFQEHENPNRLNIRIDNEDKTKLDECKLKLLELPKDNMSIPEISFEAVVTINSAEFHKVCRELKSQGAENVEIKCLKNELVLTGDDEGERVRTFTTKMNNISVQVCQEDDTKDKPFVVTGVYELKNLVLFAKCAQLCPDIEIYLKNNFALLIRYPIANLGRLILVLSPVKEEDVDSDEEDDDKYRDDMYYSDDAMIESK